MKEILPNIFAVEAPEDVINIAIIDGKYAEYDKDVAIMFGYWSNRKALASFHSLLRFHNLSGNQVIIEKLKP